MIEYTALAVLAMLAILVMGSYVVRSINAYFKSSEDTIDESYSEILLQSNRGVEGMNCRCDIFEEADHCGPHGEVNCQPYEIAVHYQCEPEGPACPKYWGCKYAREACCGDDGDCNDDDPDHPCPYGQRAYFTNCKNEPVAYYCDDDPECLKHCNPIDLPHNDGPEGNPDYTQWCMINDEPAGPRPPGLRQDTNVVYVTPGQCTGIMCEAECYPPFAPRSGSGRAKTNCTCPLPEVVVPGNSMCCHPDAIYDAQKDFCVYNISDFFTHNYPSSGTVWAFFSPRPNVSIDAMGARTRTKDTAGGKHPITELDFTSYIFFRNPPSILEWYFVGGNIQTGAPIHTCFNYSWNCIQWGPVVLKINYDFNSNILTWVEHDSNSWIEIPNSPNSGSANVPLNTWQVIHDQYTPGADANRNFPYPFNPPVLNISGNGSSLANLSNPEITGLINNLGGGYKTYAHDYGWMQIRVWVRIRGISTNYYEAEIFQQYGSCGEECGYSSVNVPLSIVFSEQAVRLSNPTLPDSFFADYP